MQSILHNLTSDSRTTQYGIPIAATLITLQTARYLNSYFSRRALNHYVPNSTWNWSQEIVVITGGSSGIGAAIVSLLASKSITTIILDIQKPAKPLSPTVHFYETELTSSSSISHAVDRIHTHHGHPTVLINNAGIGPEALILNCPLDSVRRTFEVNVIAHYAMVQAFLPDMIAHNHGHIVTTASMASFAPRAACVDYAATKAAVQSFHDGLGVELAMHYGAPGVRTSIVHPGWVRTPMLDLLIGTEKFREATIEPEDVARAVVKQLLSGNSGQVVIPGWMGLLTGYRGWPHWGQEVANMMLSRGTREASAALTDGRWSGAKKTGA
ncbi:hypothetical protein PMZ80_011058 [Knufia obscura]|uniref:NAD(P)-binding protein n=1 Tax=Knufia obscura TaxID=1635080 RepID=A0ABR0R7T3_9EURO|nr:hypothetical protein PMZ80_011058 [Knufia obscura]